MKCPHCTVEIHPGFHKESIANGHLVGGHIWWLTFMECPACRQAIINLHSKNHGRTDEEKYLVYPLGTSRPRAPSEVPASLQEDFNEACDVLSRSPKASAALSRRCLQALLDDRGFSHHNLANAIQAALDSGKLPDQIGQNLDAIRNIGNYAAHPLKDTASGQIVGVEPQEAEWNLDVLDELFDFFYVQPEKAKAKRAALDAKLASTGHKPMKQ